MMPGLETYAKVIDVPKPHGMPYEDLTLVTSDNVSLRCYLLPQKKQLGVHTEDDDAITNDEKWDSASKVSLIPSSTPILMLSGARDDLVPQAHMRALWEVVARRDETKTSGGREYKVGLEHAKFVEFAHGGHNDTCVQTGYWSAVTEFVETVHARHTQLKKD
ncbi:hypothetical protein C0993_004797 [Termitomyces sp. T159_Od127]|nr:hypothetical protein C0993_004797 [Termitomyces sp. T159_Od127]